MEPTTYQRLQRVMFDDYLQFARDGLNHTPLLDAMVANLPPLDMSRRARFRRWRRNVAYVTRQKIAARIFPEGQYEDEC